MNTLNLIRSSRVSVCLFLFATSAFADCYCGYASTPVQQQACMISCEASKKHQQQFDRMNRQYEESYRSWIFDRPAESISQKIERIKVEQLGWNDTNQVVRNWWTEFEQMNSEKLHLVYELMEVIADLDSTIEDFFIVYRDSYTDSIDENLAILAKRTTRR